MQPFIEASATSDFLFGHVQLALEKTDKNGDPLSSCISVVDAFNKHIETNKVVGGSPVSHGFHAHMVGHMSTPGHVERCNVVCVSLKGLRIISVSVFAFVHRISFDLT